MGKAHEGIAVRPEVDGQASRILQETQGVFKNNSHLFQGRLRKYEPFDEEERGRGSLEEHQELATTVAKRLAYTFSVLNRAVDLSFQLESTNQQAKADVTVDGNVLIKDAPVTFLLGLEKKLAEWKQVFHTMPTLQAGVAWELDETQGKDVYVSKHPEVTFKTKKVTKFHTVAEATEHHPAQVRDVVENVNEGKYTTMHWSGMISSAEKADILGRIDKLSRAVKKARQRANDQEMVEKKVAKIISEFILNG